MIQKKRCQQIFSIEKFKNLDLVLLREKLENNVSEIIVKSCSIPN